MPTAPIFHRQSAVAVSVETFDDPCKALVDFGLRYLAVAVTVEKLNATDLERFRHFTPKTGELLQGKFAVAVAVILGAAVRPRGVDFTLCDPRRGAFTKSSIAAIPKFEPILRRPHLLQNSPILDGGRQGLVSGEPISVASR